jgi:hypothetical protein
MITKSELYEYFYPLFCRGWEIKRLEANVSFSDSVRDISFNNRNSRLILMPWSQDHGSPFLVRKFRFKGNRSARAFLQETFRIESEEKVRIQLVNQLSNVFDWLDSPLYFSITSPSICGRKKDQLSRSWLKPIHPEDLIKIQTAIILR